MWKRWKNCFLVFARYPQSGRFHSFPASPAYITCVRFAVHRCHNCVVDILRRSQAGLVGLMPTTVLSEPSALQLYLVVRGGIQLGLVLEAVSASSTTGLLMLSLDLCSGDRRLRLVVQQITFTGRLSLELLELLSQDRSSLLSSRLPALSPRSSVRPSTTPSPVASSRLSSSDNTA